MIDNTFATPYLCRPLDLGADIVLHSATKFIGGHGMAIGGVIVDGGRFDWEGSGKFPTLTEPYAGYHGIDLRRGVRPARLHHARPHRGRARLRRLPVAANAFYLLQGIETLRAAHGAPHARTRARSSTSSRPIRRSTRLHPCAGRPSRPCAGANSCCPSGAGSIFSFGIKGGREAGRSFIERLQLISHLANVGDAKSLVIHPASTTHAQIDAAALEGGRASARADPPSVGLEEPDDIIDDLGQALRAAQKG